jgi:hypothetical protein
VCLRDGIDSLSTSVGAKSEVTIEVASSGYSRADVAQTAERLTCNQQVAGSTPAVGCAPVDEQRTDRGSSSVGRASAFQAERRGFDSRLPLSRVDHHRDSRGAQVAQSAEHVLGKDEVGGSIPLLGLLNAVAAVRVEPRCAAGRGEVPKRPKGADCKSAGSCLRRFESSPLHYQCRDDSRNGLRS